MTEQEKKDRSRLLQEMVTSSGWKIVSDHLEEEKIYGWQTFVDLPVEKKTSKQAYDSQAKYKVIKDLIDWINSEIKIGK